MKPTLIALLALTTISCASSSVQYARGKYTETVCEKKFGFIKTNKCEDVDKEGLHIVSKMVNRGSDVDADHIKKTIDSKIVDSPIQNIEIDELFKK